MKNDLLVTWHKCKLSKKLFEIILIAHCNTSTCNPIYTSLWRHIDIQINDSSLTGAT